MCGISVIINYNARDALGFIQSMSRMVRHRGPDDEGFVFFCAKGANGEAYGGEDTPPECYTSNYAYAPQKKFLGQAPSGAFMALAHRRLSILDTSPAGHQPMCTDDQRYWIVYNGEVYNYLELRKELTELGVTFYSQSDTEVILNAYRHWGRNCLHHFNGMFAFVLYDNIEEKIFIARDRFGIKPLYYWISPYGFLALASEIKQFTILPGWHARLNGQRAYDFLNRGLLDHTDETFFANVRQIKGGEYAECGMNDLKNGISISRWYHLAPRAFTGKLEDAADVFRQLFEDSVRLRLRSDVPIGSCLSGGLDSSAIVCTTNKILREHCGPGLQKTFSARTKVKLFDEGDFIQEAVAKTRVDAYHTYPLLDELFDTVVTIIWHQDEPFNSTSIYFQWHVFKLAAQHGVKVMLDGQGADESLAGYHGFFAPRFAGLFRTLRWASLWREIIQTKRLHGFNQLYAVIQTLNILLPGFLRQVLMKLVENVHGNPSWLNMDVLGADNIDPVAARRATCSSVDQLSYSQLTATHLPMLLHWEDRDSMAHSIESRVPFLDYRLVEFLLGLPEDYKLSQGITKRVLRESMCGILPEKIRTRLDKVGFVTPEEIWIKATAPDTFRSELRRAIDMSRGILNDNAMKKLEGIISSRKPFSFLIWKLISFGHWMEKFNVDLPH